MSHEGVQKTVPWKHQRPMPSPVEIIRDGIARIMNSLGWVWEAFWVLSPKKVHRLIGTQ